MLFWAEMHNDVANFGEEHCDGWQFASDSIGLLMLAGGTDSSLGDMPVVALDFRECPMKSHEIPWSY